MPDWQLNNRLMHLMYGNESLSQEVVGTEDALDNITAETLTTAYNHYYYSKKYEINCCWRFRL